MTPFEISLTIFCAITVMLFVLITVFVIKLLVDLSRLTTNSNEIVILLKNEIQPVLDQLHKTINSLNEMAKSADRQVDKIRKILSALVGVSGIAACGFKNVSGGFLKGILAGLQLFRKK